MLFVPAIQNHSAVPILERAKAGAAEVEKAADNDGEAAGGWAGGRRSHPIVLSFGTADNETTTPRAPL